MSDNTKVYDLEALESGECLRLKDAELLYQPVRGTSHGSRYFLVAANAMIKIGVRCKMSSVEETPISVRIEGQAMESAAFREHLQWIGFGVHYPNDPTPYASVHVAVNSSMMAKKMIGGILLSIFDTYGPDWSTPLPDLNVILGEGS